MESSCVGSQRPSLHTATHPFSRIRGKRAQPPHGTGPRPPGEGPPTSRWVYSARDRRAQQRRARHALQGSCATPKEHQEETNPRRTAVRGSARPYEVRGVRSGGGEDARTRPSRTGSLCTCSHGTVGAPCRQGTAALGGGIGGRTGAKRGTEVAAAGHPSRVTGLPNVLGPDPDPIG